MGHKIAHFKEGSEELRSHAEGRARPPVMTQSGVGHQGRDHGAGVLSPPSHTNAAPESHPAAPLTRPSLENVQRSYSDATVILLTPKLSTN